MSSVINTNISAIAAQNSLRTSGLGQEKAMERLSTGLRINNAKDDAAGLAISTRMTANIRGIAAAVRNANDGISLTQTAEGSLSAIQDNLQRIRELAVQAANSSNTVSDRATLNAEAAQLVNEIDRVASGTNFNGITLLDGTYQNQSIQVGAGNGTADRLTISIASAKASALGVGSGSSYSTSVTAASAPTGSGLAAGDLTINGYAVGATVSDGVSSSSATGSAIAIANAINGITGQTGVTATVAATTVAGTTVAGAVAVAAGDITINGVKLGAIAAPSVATGPERGAQTAAAVNAVSSQTGVTATFDSTTGAVALSAADGRNITIAFTGAATAASTGLGAAGTTVSKVTLTSTSASGITVAANTAAGKTGSGFTAVGYTAATATAGAGVSSIDLTTLSGSQAALSTLDSAINTVTNSRASMGAYQNRLAAAITNLSTTTMNLQASRSRILDTDYAQETTNLAKTQIIQQAATAMLAQANQSSQSVLALLK